MVFAKDMHKRVEQVRREQEEKERKKEEKRINQANEKTKEYCNSVLSRMIEEAVEKGKNSLSIDTTREDKDGISNLFEYDIEYHITDTIIILEKMKNILQDHGYKITVTKQRFCTHYSIYSDDIWCKGYTVTITW